MKCIAKKPIKLKTSKGIITLKPGDIFEPSNPEAVKPLIQSGNVELITYHPNKPPYQWTVLEIKEFICLWLKKEGITSNTNQEIMTHLPELWSDLEPALKAIENYPEDGYIEPIWKLSETIQKLYLKANDLLKGTKSKIAYKVWSDKLNCYLWVVPDDETAKRFKKDNPETIYTLDEIKKLKGSDTEHLKAVHLIKSTLGGKVLKTNKNSKRGRINVDR